MSSERWDFWSKVCALYESTTIESLVVPEINIHKFMNLLIYNISEEYLCTEPDTDVTGNVLNVCFHVVEGQAGFEATGASIYIICKLFNSYIAAYILNSLYGLFTSLPFSFNLSLVTLCFLSF